MRPPNALEVLRDRAEDFVNMVSKGHSICLCAACKPVVIEMLMDSLAQHALASEAALREVLADALTGIAFIKGEIEQKNYGTAIEYCEMHDKKISEVLGCDSLASPSGQPAPTCPHCGVPLIGMNSNPDECLHAPSGQPALSCEYCANPAVWNAPVNGVHHDNWGWSYPCKPALVALKAEVRLEEAKWWQEWYGDPEEVSASLEAQEHLAELRALAAPPAVTRDKE